MADLGAVIAEIDELLTEAEADEFPWSDAAVWSSQPEDTDPPSVIDPDRPEEHSGDPPYVIDPDLIEMINPGAETRIRIGGKIILMG